MIDIENFVYDRIASQLEAEYIGIYCTSSYDPNPASFPAVSIVEIDNSVLGKQISSNIENAAKLTYEVNVYSNVGAYRKRQAKQIAGTVDEIFESLGFIRTMSNPIQNLQDSSIYRIVARYEGIDQPEQSDDETIHRIYTT